MPIKHKISEDCEAARHYDCELCSCECHEENEFDEEDADDDFKEEMAMLRILEMF